MSLRCMIVIVLTSLCAGQVHAESGGQIPYPEKSRVIIRQGADVHTTGSLTVTNPGSRPWLMQAWLENENGVREGHVYPELSRLEASFSRRLLIAPSQSQWSAEREGLNWLVIKLIPSMEPDGRNRLTIPVMLKLKVFLRSRSAGVEQEKPVLSCDLRSGGRLMLHNHGRHYVTLAEMKGIQEQKLDGMPLMLAPDTEQSVGGGMTSGTYVYGYVDDRGVIVYERVICR
ncbi:molecular chaperone [Escherichia coli]|uniref:fimbrial biogenesis chaperone n=1 Tax=Escherichia coli TaxID=562 RepID=UPI0006A52926|nr:fimbria/pilus periplasmic chaperone [Escherichia coli]CUA13306.1 CS12 fimbria chaperone protein [Escherichia coli]